MARLPALLGLLALACCSTVHALSPIGTVDRPATPLPQRMEVQLCSSTLTPGYLQHSLHVLPDLHPYC